MFLLVTLNTFSTSSVVESSNYDIYNFKLLLPKFNFWMGDWPLGSVPTQIWEFSNIP